MTESIRLDCIQKYINKKPIDGYIVKETKDKDGNERYIVCRIDNRTKKQILEDKIKTLQSKLDKIINKENEYINEHSRADTPTIEQSK